MLPLLPLLLPCCSAQSRKAVVALRGDAFRFGHNSKQGCVHVNQSYANQLWQVESIKRYVIEPLRAAGYAVAVTGVVYEGCDAAWTRAIAAALAHASDATRIDFALPRRDELSCTSFAYVSAAYATAHRRAGSLGAALS